MLKFLPRSSRFIIMELQSSVVLGLQSLPSTTFIHASDKFTCVSMSVRVLNYGSSDLQKKIYYNCTLLFGNLTVFFYTIQYNFGPTEPNVTLRVRSVEITLTSFVYKNIDLLITNLVCGYP